MTTQKTIEQPERGASLPPRTGSPSSKKLGDILKEITPLPWPSSADHDDAPAFEHQPNWDYARHAANVLPALVNAVREYTTERTYKNVSACKKDQDRLETLLLAELSKAEEVEMENESSSPTAGGGSGRAERKQWINVIHQS